MPPLPSFAFLSQKLVEVPAFNGGLTIRAFPGKFPVEVLHVTPVTQPLPGTNHGREYSTRE